MMLLSIESDWISRMNIIFILLLIHGKNKLWRSSTAEGSRFTDSEDQKIRGEQGDLRTVDMNGRKERGGGGEEGVDESQRAGKV